MNLFEEINLLLEANNPMEIAQIIFKLAETKSKGSLAGEVRQLKQIMGGIQNIVEDKIKRLNQEL